MKHREKKPRKRRFVQLSEVKAHEPKEHKHLELVVVLLTVIEVLLKIIKELLH